MTAFGSLDDRTRVELIWIQKRIERWIRFGVTVEDQVLDRRRRQVAFAPDSVFAYVRWASNDFGTVVSRIDVLRAVHPGEPHQTVPGVTPGAEILLRIQGWPKVQQVLEMIDAIEATGVAAIEVAPDHWRHIHNRLTARETPRPYTAERHRAWLQRKRRS
jgi:hypothetical protein